LGKYSIILYKNRIFALVVVCLMVLIGCKSFDYLTKAENTFPAAKTCGECHIDIFNEWSQSAHAQAFTSPDFLAGTNEGQFSECLACHSPEPELTIQKPLARHVMLEDAVTCTSCHLKDGKMLGPVESTAAVQPHPIKTDKTLYTDAAFCGRCHDGTFQQWRGSEIESKPTCQECHMPAIVRKVTQGRDTVSNFIVSMEKTSALRKHTFRIYPEQEKRQIFEIETSFDSNSVTIELKNNLPHSFPTGNFGVQIGILQIKFMDNEGNELRSNKIEFVQELKTDIPSGESGKLIFSLPEKTIKINIIVSREGRSGKKQVELLNKEVPRL
jgi:nitrate/TMAO reductase-like tetraheme cytochrome c subunit